MSHGFLRDMLRLSDCAPCSASSRSGPHRVLSLVAPARLADATGLPRHPWIPVADRQGLGMHRQHEAGASIEVFFGERVGHSEKKEAAIQASRTPKASPLNTTLLWEKSNRATSSRGSSSGQTRGPHYPLHGNASSKAERTETYLRKPQGVWMESSRRSCTTQKLAFESRKSRKASSKVERGGDGVQPHIFHCTEMHLRKPKTEMHLRKPQKQKCIFESQRRSTPRWRHGFIRRRRPRRKFPFTPPASAVRVGHSEEHLVDRAVNSGLNEAVLVSLFKWVCASVGAPSPAPSWSSASSVQMGLAEYYWFIARSFEVADG
ncbi:uncharacterized protein LOC144155217 isoform X1 [Haemaphysalis longicornis]